MIATYLCSPHTHNVLFQSKHCKSMSHGKNIDDFKKVRRLAVTADPSLCLGTFRHKLFEMINHASIHGIRATSGMDRPRQQKLNVKQPVHYIPGIADETSTAMFHTITLKIASRLITSWMYS